MKNLLICLIFCLIACLSAKSQGHTLELTPVFQNQHSAYISDVIDFNTSFRDLSFIGISCYHLDAQTIDIQYRLLRNGVWTEWFPFAPQHEFVSSARKAYEGPFIALPFSALQFKKSSDLTTNLTFRLFLGNKLNSVDVYEQKSALCPLPEVCGRSCWCADCPIDNTPELTTPTHIIIHHSAGSNQVNLNYSEVVEYIWDLHVNTNGWDDIGYNWLIDPNGLLYEGRPDTYQGAHFSCINENTVGVCLLGDFTFIEPSEEAINSLVELIAYEAVEHDIDVLGESYHETGEFLLSNIAGHRDSSGSENSCSSTACPGDTFYPMLDQIRSVVSELDCYQNTVSSADVGVSQKWTVVPNPFSSSLIIKHEGQEQFGIQLRDVNGQIIERLKTNQSYDLSYLPNGMYFVFFDGQIIEKLIKNN